MRPPGGPPRTRRASRRLEHALAELGPDEVPRLDRLTSVPRLDGAPQRARRARRRPGGAAQRASSASRLRGVLPVAHAAAPAPAPSARTAPRRRRGRASSSRCADRLVGLRLLPHEPEPRRRAQRRPRAARLPGRRRPRRTRAARRGADGLELDAREGRRRSSTHARLVEQRARLFATSSSERAEREPAARTAATPASSPRASVARRATPRGTPGRVARRRGRVSLLAEDAQELRPQLRRSDPRSSSPLRALERLTGRARPSPTSSRARRGCRARCSVSPCSRAQSRAARTFCASAVTEPRCRCSPSLLDVHVRASGRARRSTRRAGDADPRRRRARRAARRRTRGSSRASSSGRRRGARGSCRRATASSVQSRRRATSSAASSVQPPREDGEARRTAACSSGVEQVVAPVDRRAQRLLALRRVAAPPVEQRRAAARAGRVSSSSGERPSRARRRARSRAAGRPGAGRARRARVAGVVESPSPLAEELDRRVPRRADGARTRARPRSRSGSRLVDEELQLGDTPSRSAASSGAASITCSRLSSTSSSSRVRRRARRPALARRALCAIASSTSARVANAARGRRSQTPCSKSRNELGASFEREPRLADAARPGERDDARLVDAHEAQQVAELALSPEQRLETSGQVRVVEVFAAAGSFPRRAGRAARLAEVLEPVLAEVA